MCLPQTRGNPARDRDHVREIAKSEIARVEAELAAEAAAKARRKEEREAKKATNSRRKTDRGQK
jgi:hypothetical protein